MKKTFILLKTPKDLLNIVLFLTLCACAASLFFLPDKSVAVFADGAGSYPRGIFGLFSQLVG